MKAYKRHNDQDVMSRAPLASDPADTIPRWLPWACIVAVVVVVVIHWLVYGG